ncbi:MAG TPA: hypothetical protein VFD29_05785 [Gillisia sp.]|nr:hypothetical protein [Gillisia sp.]
MNDNLQILFSGVVTISTVVYAFLTWKLVKETRLMRHYQNTPDIQIFFDRGETASKYLYLNIMNRGMGTAMNVEFEILNNLTSYQDKYFNVKQKGAIKNGIRFFYPNQSFRYLLLNISQDNYEVVNSENLKIDVTYSDIFKEKIKREFLLYPREFMGMGVLNPPDNYLGKIAHYLQKLDSSVKGLRESIDNLSDVDKNNSSVE